MTKTEVSVSPIIMGEISSLLPPDLSMDLRIAETEYWVQQIIVNAKLFVEKFLTVSEFFNKEPYHEFTGISLTDAAGKITHRINFLMQYAPPELGIFSIREIKMHEEYHIRKVIAESHFPEYQNDLWPQMLERY